MVVKLFTKVKDELITETSIMLRVGLSVVHLVTVTGTKTGYGNEINSGYPLGYWGACHKRKFSPSHPKMSF